LYRYTAVCGETGSGKTTQAPQYLLDDAIERGVGAGCRVICTQPRRVAALTVADRVASERCERGGVGGGGSLVGHHVRLDAAVTKDTRLTFMTAGILLRRMHGDPLLSDVSHVVLDEIHERTLDGDFLLALLRTLPAKRRELDMAPLKLVVMSATLDAGLFCGYLGQCPVVQAAGRTHPVTTVYLEDVYDTLVYALDEESRSCRRPQGEGRNAGALEGLDRKERAAMQDSWGIDDCWRGDENPDYDPALFEGNSSLTNRNLSRVDESVIDYDLIEALLGHVDDEVGLYELNPADP
jgi:ATP-dependent RNA helicase DHX29